MMYNRTMTCRQAEATAIRPSWFGTLLLALYILSACADNRVAGGNSSGTSNTITGRLVDSLGHGVKGVHVVARSLQWRSEDSGAPSDLVRHAVSDSSGLFAFDSMPPDAWILEASASGAGYLFAPAVSGASHRDADVGTGVLGRMAPLFGRLRGDALHGVAGRIRISGTTHVAVFDAAGRFRIDAVPPGVARLVGSADAGGISFGMDATLPIPRSGSRDTVVLEAIGDEDEDYSGWRCVKRATIDLASESVYLSSDQHGVPILVRLDGSILPEWDLDGSSIRFSSEHGRHLPFEIEEWNPVLRNARIWVRMDTLNGGSSKHSLYMHWGKEDAPNRSNGAAVFDSTAGWQGVWHFAEARPWRNSTGRIPTFARGSEAGASFPGCDGIGVDPESRLVLSDPALATSAGVAAFAFVRIDSASMERSFLFRQGAEDSTSFDWALSLRDSSGVLLASFATRLQPWSPAPPKTTGAVPRSTWTLVGGIFDTAARRARLELPDDQNRWTIPYDTFHVRNSSPVLVVGGGIVGTIDEIRLLRVPVHPDFVRAQWLSWKPSSEMLRWQE